MYAETETDWPSKTGLAFRVIFIQQGWIHDGQKVIAWTRKIFVLCQTEIFWWAMDHQKNKRNTYTMVWKCRSEKMCTSLHNVLSLDTIVITPYRQRWHLHFSDQKNCQALGILYWGSVIYFYVYLRPTLYTCIVMNWRVKTSMTFDANVYWKNWREVTHRQYAHISFIHSFIHSSFRHTNVQDLTNYAKKITICHKSYYSHKSKRTLCEF